VSRRREGPEELAPQTAADLAAVDAALGGRDVAPDQSDLAELAVDLRALREEPDPAFLAQLDARIEREVDAAGSAQYVAPAPAQAASRRGWRWRPALTVLAPLGAAAAAVAVALLVATGGGSPDRLPVQVRTQAAPAPRQALKDQGASGAAPAPAPAGGALERAAGVRVTVRDARPGAGQPVVLAYTAPEPTRLTVRMTPSDGGKTLVRRFTVQGGSGTVRIGAGDVAGDGLYQLEVTGPGGRVLVRSPVRVP